VVSYPPALFPRSIQWGNYPTAWNTVEFGPFFRNSLIVTVLSLVGGTATGLVVAYGFSRFRFPAATPSSRSALDADPAAEVTTIPLFIVFRAYGWLDTLKPLWVPSFFGGGAFTIFLLRQFILTLPYELDEAATIDGASKLRILFDVIVPNAKPALAAAAVFSFISHWNEFFQALIFLNSRENFTIPLGLVALRNVRRRPRRAEGPPPDGRQRDRDHADRGRVLRRPALLRAGHRDDRDQGLADRPVIMRDCARHDR